MNFASRFPPPHVLIMKAFATRDPCVVILSTVLPTRRPRATGLGSVAGSGPRRRFAPPHHGSDCMGRRDLSQRSVSAAAQG